MKKFFNVLLNPETVTTKYFSYHVNKGTLIIYLLVKASVEVGNNLFKVLTWRWGSY